jgi:NAD+ kinase
MRKIAIFGNIYKDETIESAKILLSALKQKDVEIVTDSAFLDFLKKNVRNSDLDIIDTIADDEDFEADLALSIGGDGTFLKTANRIGNKDIPILGINTGRLGFLADVSINEIEQAVDTIDNNNYIVEQRSLVKLSTDNPAFENPFALNEIAILKQDSSSMIAVEVHINGEYLHTYQSDGLIIATPTGSTAYSMSVGGPIVVPQVNSLIISPVAPHSLNIRPLVIPDSWTIELKVSSRNNSFLVSLDGRSKVFSTADKLHITKGDYTIGVIKQPNHTFFNTLKNKLMWGIDKRK